MVLVLRMRRRRGARANGERLQGETGPQKGEIHEPKMRDLFPPRSALEAMVRPGMFQKGKSDDSPCLDAGRKTKEATFCDPEAVLIYCQ